MKDQFGPYIIQVEHHLLYSSCLEVPKSKKSHSVLITLHFPCVIKEIPPSTDWPHPSAGNTGVLGVHKYRGVSRSP